MGLVQIASIVGVPLALGAALLSALGIRPRSDRLAWFAWASLAGGLGIGALLNVWCWTGAPIDARWLVPVSLALAALLALFGRNREPALVAQPARAWLAAPSAERAFFWIALGAVLALSLARIALASLHPVMEGDEAHHWSLKAKILYESGGFGAAYVRTLEEPLLIFHNAYPILNPLLQLWAFAHAGEIAHVENRLPIQVFVPALYLLLGASLRRHVRPAFAALLLLAIASLPAAHEQAATAMTDGMVALALVALLDAWLRWRERREPAALALFGMALAFLCWTKNEGLMWCAALLGAWLLGALLPGGGGIAALKPARGARWLLLPLVPLAATAAFNSYYGFANDLTSGDYRESGMAVLFFEQFAERWRVIPAWIWSRVLAPPEVNAWILLAALALALLFPLRVLSGELRRPTLALLLALLALYAVYIGTPHVLQWHLETSAPRVASQMVPAVAVWVAVVAGATLPSKIHLRFRHTSDD